MKKQIGQRLSRPGMLVDGDVAAIPLKNGGHGYALIYADATLGILEIPPTEEPLPLDEIEKRGGRVAFFMGYAEPTDHPEWIYLGCWNFGSKKEAAPPPVYIEDVISPGTFRIVDGHRVYLATKEEITGLEKQVLYFPEHIRKRLEVYFQL